MRKALHPRDNVDGLCVKEWGGAEDLPSIEGSVYPSIQWLEDNIEKYVGRQIKVTRNNTNDTRTCGTKITRKKSWKKSNSMDVLSDTSNISHKKTWTWLRRENIKRKTDSFLIAAQNNAIRTNHMKARIDKTQQNS